jgi:hypothetical protein
LSLALCVAAALGANARAAAAKGAGQKAAAAAAAVNPYAGEIDELVSIQTLLQNADHDYKGHRATAVKEITAAVQVLKQAGPLPAAKAAKGAGKAAKKEAKAMKPKAAAPAKGAHPAIVEPQAISDVQLKEAVLELGIVQKQLAAIGGPPAAKAIVALEAAGKELQIALTIR